MRKTKFSRETVNAIKRYVRRGVSKNNIARMMGVPWSTVDRLFRR